MNTSIPLNDEEHQTHQMLVGIMNWVVCLGINDVFLEGSSLYCLSFFTRKGNLDWVLRALGYLNKNNNQRVVVDTCDSILVGGVEDLKIITPIYLQNLTLILHRR